MNYVGLFEGISGFGLAFKRAGANILAVCEIDKTCQSVLRRHHPEAEIISDVKTITKESFGNATIDILAGGFPCQDLSVAGLRKGLDGERSGLWFEFLRIITDHKPRIVVIENVPGLLSSNRGRDFAVILRGLVKCGYGVCWRILDSQYDGVAQRRNRVFIVASLGTASCAEVLFEREGSAWDSPPSREAGEDVAGTLSARTSAGGGLGTDFECAGGLQAFGGNNTSGSIDVATACNAHGGTGRMDFGSETFLVVPTLRSNGDAHSGFTTGDGLVIESQATAYNLTFCDVNGRRADRPNGGLYVNETERANTITNAQQGGTVLANQIGVRRLTPTECERLQGFPEVENTAIIEICSDLLKSLANAESQNLKSPKPAGNVEKIESNQSAKRAELDLQPKHQPTKKHAQSDVRIFCEGGGVGIANQEKSLWFASNAEKQNWFLPSTKPEDFVQAIARICSIAGQITRLGEAAFHQSEICSITHENGSPLVRLFGGEIMQPANDAIEGLTIQSKPTKFITSSPLPVTLNLEQQLITSCCSVVSAITGFIPKRTQKGNSFRIELKTKFGWTAFGNDGKPISDSARYRMLGNAVCVPTAEWIARRVMNL